MTKNAVDMSVEAAVRRDIDEIASRDAWLAQSGLAASALALARELDNPNSATSKSMCGRTLLETLDRLRELSPPAKKHDRIDELAGRRAARRAA